MIKITDNERLVFLKLNKEKGNLTFNISLQPIKYIIGIITE